MIPTETVELTQVIARGLDANEAKVAAEIATPKQEISTDELLHLRHFAEFCRGRGVRSKPAHPATVARYCRSQAAFGVPGPRIFDALEAIEAEHDNGGFANPIATAPVRTELGRLFNLDNQPRSWPPRDRLKYNALPIELKIVIDRRETQNTRALRRLQNDFALLKQKGT
jgi:hypothetical protein